MPAILVSLLFNSGRSKSDMRGRKIVYSLFPQTQVVYSLFSSNSLLSTFLSTDAPLLVTAQYHIRIRG